MEVKINKEIRQYKENIFFGLSLRQFVYSFIACIVVIGIYFIFRPIFNIGTVSWLCIAGAVPFALLGFVKYNGMTAGQFFIAWVKSEMLMPKKLVFKPNNLYMDMYKQCEKNKKNKKEKKEAEEFENY